MFRLPPYTCRKSERATKGTDSPSDGGVSACTVAFCACPSCTQWEGDRSCRSGRCAGLESAARRPRRYPDGATLHRHYGPLWTTTMKDKSKYIHLNSHYKHFSIVIFYILTPDKATTPLVETARNSTATPV